MSSGIKIKHTPSRYPYPRLSIRRTIFHQGKTIDLDEIKGVHRRPKAIEIEMKPEFDGYVARYEFEYESEADTWRWYEEIVKRWMEG